MTIRRLLLVVSLLILPRTSATASKAYPDYVFLNLQRFAYAEQRPTGTNGAVVSWAGVCDVLRGSGNKSRSAAEVTRLRELGKITLLGRTFALPLLVLFILVHTRSFIRPTRRGAWGLLVLLLLWWCISGPASMFDTGLMCPFVGLFLSALVIVFRDHVRVGARLTWFGILLIAICLFCPLEEWLVPKGYEYLTDYEFPEYSASVTSTNLVAAHERLDLRPDQDWKVVLFNDGRRSRVKRSDLEELLQTQKMDLRVPNKTTGGDVQKTAPQLRR